MTLIYENEQNIVLPFDPEETAEAVLEKTMETEGCPYEVSVNLLLTDNERIHALNRDFRNIDRATDVLSFPMIPFLAPADYRVLDTAEDVFDPDSGELLLGDIVISVERAEAQANEYGHSLRREFAFLVAHSALHLLGYDHMTPEEAEVMEAKQEGILQALGITRD